MDGMERLQFAALILPSEFAREAKRPEGMSHLSPIAGKSLHEWVIDAALGASVRRVAVVSPTPADALSDDLASRPDDMLISVVSPAANVLATVEAAIEGLGTDFIFRDTSHVLLLSESCPQIRSTDLRRIIDHHVESCASVTTCAGEVEHDHTEPVITRDRHGRVASITDVAVGGGAIACFRAEVLVPALRRSARGSTFQGIAADVASVLGDAGHRVETLDYPGPLEIVRSGASRTTVEATLRQRVIKDWIERGVVMADPAQVTIDATVHLGKGVEVLPGTVIEGRTIVADGARIGPNSHLVDAVIGSSAEVPHSVVRGVEVPPRSVLTPFSVLGPSAD